MSQILELPLGGLDNPFPGVVYVYHSKATNKYSCSHVQHPEFGHIRVLICYPSEVAARSHWGTRGTPGMEIVDLSFEEAREVAQSKNLDALALVVSSEKVELHFVK